MTTIFKHFRIGLRRSAALLALAFATGATAQTILVTPGSLANYTYIPPGSGSGSGSGGGTGENVSTLQRCLWAPATADKSVTVPDKFYDYNKDVTVYYRIAGGDGGAGPLGGGGGSSAILKNGTVVALGPGGNGGQAAPEVSGTFTIKKGDNLRFITGGGGGDGHAYGTNNVGGGGGAGYTGGGGGGSLAGRGLNGADTTTSPGKGGGATPGQGGYISGGMAGTTAIGQSGGVPTWPDNNSAPIGSFSSGQYLNQYYGKYNNTGPDTYYVTMTIRHPATPSMQGSPTGRLPVGGARSGQDGVFSGGGGSLGWGGARAIFLSVNPPNGWCNVTSKLQDTGTYSFVDDNTVCATYYNQYRYHRTNTFSHYPPHTTDLRLTRRINPIANGNESAAGSLPGQIVTMYQAPVCGLLE